MRFVAILFAALFAPAPPPPQTAPVPARPIAIPQPDGRPFVVHLPDGVSGDTCAIDAYQTGTFGGYSAGAEAAKISARTVAIPTSKAAQSLKGIVWCKSLGVALVDVPSLVSSNYDMTVSPPRMKSLRVNARLQPDDAAVAGGKDMRITFEAAWVCAFFNVLDCMVPRFPIATARIGKDGAVSFDVPDVLADPVLKKYGFFGSFAMDVEEPAPSFNYYRLEPPGGRTLAPASAYRDTIVLTIRK